MNTNINQFDKNYHDILEEVLNTGQERKDRTGVGIIYKFGITKDYDISEKFPLITTKTVYWKGIVHELLWFIKGDTNVKYLQDNGVRIWDEWADKDGNLGPVYGKQLRDYNGEVDQLETVIHQIKTMPFSRRKVITLWKPDEIHKMALPPCHGIVIQFETNDVNGTLDCYMHQRSGDLFLGVPFNIASYSLLTYMVAQVCNLKPGRLIHSIGNAHIYLNHVDAVKTQLSRLPYEPPSVILNKSVTDINNFTYNDIILNNYVRHPTIKAEVAV